MSKSGTCASCKHKYASLVKQCPKCGAMFCSSCGSGSTCKICDEYGLKSI